ncbi:restriction endonuclease subunit S [Comamonas testosteroni]
MDAQQFLAEFGHIANSPGGVTRLRELVLHLAVSGRLGSHVAGESAADFLDEIQEVRTALQAEGAIRANRKVRSEKQLGPWEVPKNWIWCRFGELCHFSAGRTPSRKEGKYWNTGDYPWFSIADLRHGQVVSSSSETVSEDARAEVFKSEPCPIGSLLMSFKLSIGKISLLGVAAYHNEAIIEIKPFSQSLKDYFFKCLNGFDLTAGNKAAIKGNTLNQDSLSNILIALPPKDDIPRIVAKVDELMALCDQLEQQQQDRCKLQNALRQSTLQALASAQSPHELQTSWQRLQANFGCLFNGPADVDDIIAELRNLSVRGVLVETSKAPADLARITSDCSALRSKYIAAGLMRRQKLVGMAERDMTYPEHWAVAAFDEVAVVIGGVTKGRDLRGKQVVVCPYLAVANVQRGYFKLEHLKSIEIAEEELPKYLVHEGDLLITEGGDWDKVGRTAIWQGRVENCLHQNHVFKARVPSEKLLKAWVELVFNSGIGRDYFAGASKQTTNLASINMTQLRSFPLPIPPVDEQRRILDALAALTDLCDEWRTQLKHKGDLATLFAAASVASLTGISIEQDEETAVKAPQTELIAPLHLAAPPDVKAQAPLATLLARHQGEMAARDLWQRFGGEIDAFYAQLKTEVAHGWIAEPVVAQVREKAATEAAKA